MSALQAVPPEAAGGHAYLNACMTTEGEGGISVAALADPVCLAPLVACFAATVPGGDRRAIGSMWWQYYASQLLVPAVALLTRGIVVDPHGPTCASVGERGLVHGFRVTLSPEPPASDTAWLEEFIETHCRPITLALKRVTSVSYRVLWSDAARRLQRFCDSNAGLDLARIRRLVEAGPAGMGNPLHDALRDGRPVTCCLRDRLPGYATCPDCPVVRYAPISVSTCAAAELDRPSRS